MDAHFLILRNVHPEKQKNVCQYLEFEKRASQKAKNGCQLLNYEKLTSSVPLKGSGGYYISAHFFGFLNSFPFVDPPSQRMSTPAR